MVASSLVLLLLFVGIRYQYYLALQIVRQYCLVEVISISAYASISISNRIFFTYVVFWRRRYRSYRGNVLRGPGHLRLLILFRQLLCLSPATAVGYTILCINANVWTYILLSKALTLSTVKAHISYGHMVSTFSLKWIPKPLLLQIYSSSSRFVQLTK